MAAAAAAAGATATSGSGSGAPRNGAVLAGKAAAAAGGGVLVPPPITKIRLSPPPNGAAGSRRTAATAAVPAAAAAAAPPPTFARTAPPSYGSGVSSGGVGPGSGGGGSVGSGSSSVGCVPVAVAVGGLTRKSSRNRMPPVVPGWEPDEQEERDREEREAEAAQAAVARATWVFDVRDWREKEGVPVVCLCLDHDWKKCGLAFILDPEDHSIENTDQNMGFRSVPGVAQALLQSCGGVQPCEEKREHSDV